MSRGREWPVNSLPGYRLLWKAAGARVLSMEEKRDSCPSCLSSSHPSTQPSPGHWETLEKAWASRLTWHPQLRLCLSEASGHV